MEEDASLRSVVTVVHLRYEVNRPPPLDNDVEGPSPLFPVQTVSVRFELQINKVVDVLLFPQYLPNLRDGHCLEWVPRHFDGLSMLELPAELLFKQFNVVLKVLLVKSD